MSRRNRRNQGPQGPQGPAPIPPTGGNSVPPPNGTHQEGGSNGSSDLEPIVLPKDRPTTGPNDQMLVIENAYANGYARAHAEATQALVPILERFQNRELEMKKDYDDRQRKLEEKIAELRDAAPTKAWYLKLSAVIVGSIMFATSMMGACVMYFQHKSNEKTIGLVAAETKKSLLDGLKASKSGKMVQPEEVRISPTDIDTLQGLVRLFRSSAKALQQPVTLPPTKAETPKSVAVPPPPPKVEKVLKGVVVLYNDNTKEGGVEIKYPISTGEKVVKMRYSTRQVIPWEGKDLVVQIDGVEKRFVFNPNDPEAVVEFYIRN